MAKTRDAHGKLQPDPVRFPSGMANLSAYVHSKGLKLGIYEASGGGTCCGFPGTDGPTHAVADVDQFSAWNIDMLKWDGCGPGAGGDYNKSYTAMYEALTRPHIRPMVYSCSWPAYINIPGNSTTIPRPMVDCCVGTVLTRPCCCSLRHLLGSSRGLRFCQCAGWIRISCKDMQHVATI